MQIKKMIVPSAIVFLIAVAAISIGRLPGSSEGLRAQLIVSKADIGIPGISKMYEAKLVNRGLWPVRISRCDFVDDSFSPGKMDAYAV
jgi:hypothetical protein